MLDKLKQIQTRFAEIETALSDPSVFAKQDEMKKLVAERKAILPLIEPIERFFKISDSIEEALLLEKETIDLELKSLAAEEIHLLTAEKEELYSVIQKLLIPKDPDDDKSVVVEIRAGTGGEEAALFAADLFRMYRMYAETHSFRLEMVGENPTDLGGYKEVSFLMEGSGAFGRMKYESGVHRVQRVPETESQGRIQTSAVTVAVLPQAEEVEITINPSDIKIESCKSSGAGGQHVNKTESAVRITHLPTGMVVECQEERSQFKNKDKALKLLRTRLYQIKQKEQTDSIASTRKSQVGTGDRSEKIRTYHFPQSRVTDHRIGMTLYSLSSFLNGELDEMIDALAAADMAEKLTES